VAEGLHYDLPPYDAARLMEEVMLLPDWFLPAASGRTASPEALAAYRALWAPLLAEVAGGLGTLVLRDYHADNLMVTPHGLGLLDYQDAVIGHPAYDLVSLLEDARRDVPPVLAAAMLDHYLALAPVGDEARFRRAFDILGAQRNAKIVGIFARLSRRDGKDRYLDLIPRVWRLLEADLTRLDAAGLIAWLETHIEEAWRRRPLGTAQAKKD
jgi:aminoglycoside/choline kinase family phosphotransferase